jgi:curli biogenesis system outer membrane secretion channel CsgG
LLLAAVPLAAQSGGLRYTITVTKFENRAGWHGHWDIGDAWGTVMTDLLQQSGKFIVLGESDMRAEALAEQDLGASGRTAGGGKTPVTGQLTPAQLLVKGAITHVQESTTGGGGGIRVRGIGVGGGKDKAEINATIYLVDSTTGQVVASKSVVGEAGRRAGRFSYSGSNFGGDVAAFKKDNVGKAVESAVSEAVDWLIEQLPGVPWTGTVALIKDGKIYVNRGSREGVASGQTFVVGTAEVIRDPDTGEVLDTSMNTVATLKAVDVKEKLSICEVTTGSAAKVQKGMAVHLP